MNLIVYKIPKAKHRIVFLLMFLLKVSLFGQAPQAFKYQAVIRDTDGVAIINTPVSLRISILVGDPINDSVIFVEVHNVETGFNGLVSLNIGQGNHLQGEFNSIDWSSGQYHIKIELKIGTGEFVMMGVSQLLSVPFALNAEESRLTSGIKSLSWSEIQNLQNPQPGSMYFASDSLKVALYNGSGWFFFEPCPPVNPANAGPHYHCVCAPFTLPDNPPGIGNCYQWEIVDYPHLTSDSAYLIYTSDDSVRLYGQPGIQYTVRKSNFNHCENSTHTTTVLFEYYPTQPDAGEDRLNVDSTEVTLSGNPLQTERETGKWLIVSETGGWFENDTLPNTKFFGARNQMYKLAWTITNACSITFYDTMQVSFCPEWVDPQAGSNLSNQCIPFILQANFPGVGNLGTWSAVPETGCSFSDIHDPNAAFTGERGHTYQLTWTISNACRIGSQSISVHLADSITVPIAGTNALNIENTFTTLNANQPQIGTGQWSILSGIGGTIDSINNPNSIFSGLTNQLYELEWRISNDCETLADTVLVSFFNCGDTLYDDRDDSNNPEHYPTILIGSQCWMAKNLNVGIGLGFGEESSDNSVIEKICFYYSELFCDSYGGLYTWDEAMNYSLTQGAQGICPDTWHLPSEAEYSALITYLGGTSVAGGKAKEQGFEYWYSPNTGATNSSGLTVRGSGMFSISFSGLKEYTFLWTSRRSSDNGRFIQLTNTDAAMQIFSGARTRFHSVRCLKN